MTKELTAMHDRLLNDSILWHITDDGPVVLLDTDVTHIQFDVPPVIRDRGERCTVSLSAPLPIALSGICNIQKGVRLEIHRRYCDPTEYWKENVVATLSRCKLKDKYIGAIVSWRSERCVVSVHMILRCWIEFKEKQS